MPTTFNQAAARKALPPEAMAVVEALEKAPDGPEALKAVQMYGWLACKKIERLAEERVPLVRRFLDQEKAALEISARALEILKSIDVKDADDTVADRLEALAQELKASLESFEEIMDEGGEFVSEITETNYRLFLLTSVGNKEVMDVLKGKRARVDSRTDRATQSELKFVERLLSIETVRLQGKHSVEQVEKAAEMVTGTIKAQAEALKQTKEILDEVVSENELRVISEGLRKSLPANKPLRPNL